ncbi:hypothetical protein AVEN_82796-1 [Araneus ventricosus]|uniref:Uncharacterized protein n=1 Tax=Araneus ventricosus TaxID=182803 RepID=A0A4Y2DBN5_ARAVE|nr:hypothetical protein AVEN_82796-1 [Araneus ventricosus]
MTILEMEPPSPNVLTTPDGGRLAPTYDLMCNKPNTRRIYRGIGFRIWNPPAPKRRPHHEATTASTAITKLILRVAWGTIDFGTRTQMFASSMYLLQ